MLIGQALHGRDRTAAILSVKFGAQRDPDGRWLGIDARPAAVKTALGYSLRRLRTEYVDVYRPARLDPSVPIEDTIGAIADLVRAGHVRAIGLSEVGADTIRRAHAVHPIADVQLEYSLVSRGIEGDILPTCRDLGIGVTAYGVLSRGLLSGRWSAGRAVGTDDFRAHSPRFQGDNLARNLQLVERLRGVADDLGTSVARLAIAWVLAQGEDIVPLVGSRRRDQLAESLPAAGLALTPDQIARIEAAIPPGSVAGDRYGPAQMATLDSERRPTAD